MKLERVFMLDRLQNGILVVMIANNELKDVQLNVDILRSELKDTGSEILIVDNCSDDGLKDWLTFQQDVSYVVYDEKLEGYGKILRLVEKEFDNDKDVLIMRANYFLTPGSIGKLKEALDANESIAAVGPVSNAFAGEQNCKACNYEDAVRFSDNFTGNPIVETAFIDMDVMLVRGKSLSYIDEKIDIPQAAMRNYMKSMLKWAGEGFAVVKCAVCFAVRKTNDEPYRVFNLELYKQEKLHHLLYRFGDVVYKRVHLYKYLEPEILAGINIDNHLQNTKRDSNILMWQDAVIAVSTDEEADITKKRIDSLPEREVLFITFPIRRMYQGKNVHTAIETYISSLDEDKYLDLEYDYGCEENIPTKNRYPIIQPAIPKLYGIKEVDDQEILQFIWVYFIHPLEEVLEIEFPRDILMYCAMKAVFLLRIRDGYMEFYRQVISKVRPKVIIYSHGQGTLLTFLRDTALELGIPTLEIDHGVGVVDTYHKHLVYGDYLIVYSKIVAELCRIQGNNKVLGIGKPKVYEYAVDSKKKWPVTIISFISSLESEILEYARNLARKLNGQKYWVIYKAHNSEVWRDDEIDKLEKELPNLYVIKGLTDIREIMNLSDIAVGIRSSALFDALFYPEVKIIAMKDKALNYSEAKPNDVLQEVIRQGEIIMAEDEEELYQEVLSYKRGIQYRPSVNCFWPIDAEEKFRELVDSYLQ